MLKAANACKTPCKVKWGHEVVATSDGREALDKTAEVNFDLVITDWKVPNTDGIELCKMLKIKEDTKNLPVIMVSTVKSEGEVQNAYNAGVDDFLTKPIDIRDLQNSIATHAAPPS